MAGSGIDLTEDELFELLANSRRRYIMRALAREGGPLEIGTLATEIAASEDGVTTKEVSSRARKRVYTAIQQSHLPKMDRTGVIEFEKDRGVVKPTPALETVETYIDVTTGGTVPWSEYYLGLTAFATLILGGSSLGMAPFALLPELVWIALVIASFALAATFHRLHSRGGGLASVGRLGSGESAT